MGTVLALTRMSLTHRLRGEHEGVLTGSMLVEPISAAVHVSAARVAGQAKLVHSSRITQRQHALGGRECGMLLAGINHSHLRQGLVLFLSVSLTNKLH